MYDNRNIYDLFNARKNNIDNCVESLAFDNIDDGLNAMNPTGSPRYLCSYLQK